MGAQTEICEGPAPRPFINMLILFSDELAASSIVRDSFRHGKAGRYSC